MAPALTIFNTMKENVTQMWLFYVSLSFNYVLINTLDTYCLVIRVGCCGIDGVGLDVPRDFGCCGVARVLLFSVLESSDPCVHQPSSLDR